MLIPGTEEPRHRLIVALDVPSRSEALAIVRELGGTVSFFKVGNQLLIAEGVEFVRELAEEHKVFLDVKWDDVAETITQSVRALLSKARPHLLTILGSGSTARAAVTARGASELPYILQVTLLSSLDNSDLQNDPELRSTGFKSVDPLAVEKARKSMEAGCEGVIASGTTIKAIRDAVGDDLVIVAPGIRPTGTPANDHKRSLTPYEAMAAGANYVVVGRPIRQAPSKVAMAQRIIDEIGQGMAAHVR